MRSKITLSHVGGTMRWLQFTHTLSTLELWSLMGGASHDPYITELGLTAGLGYEGLGLILQL